MHRKPSCVPPTGFAVTKEHKNTKKGSDKSMKNALYVHTAVCQKVPLGLKRCQKVKFIALPIIQLRLSEGISQLFSQSEGILGQSESLFRLSFISQLSSGKIEADYGRYYFVDHAHSFVLPTINHNNMWFMILHTNDITTQPCRYYSVIAVLYMTVLKLSLKMTAKYYLDLSQFYAVFVILSPMLKGYPKSSSFFN